MAYTVPTIEPEQITAGDRWQWDRSISDYPAPTWVLTYSLVKSDRQITLTATASGSDHRIDIAAATTADYSAGVYKWQAYVTSGTSRYMIGRGDLQVLPNLAVQTQGYEGRTFAEKRVAACEDALEARDPMIAAYTVNGRSIQYRTLDEVRNELHYWRGVVRSERAKLLMQLGKATGNRFLARL